MSKDKINFTLFELIIGQNHPKLDDLKKIFSNEFQYEPGDTFTYSISTEVIKHYFWMSIDFGATHPRSEYLIDKSQSNAKVENPRTENQIEPNKQLFIVYDSIRRVIYISNSQKKVFLEELFNKYSDDLVFIKRILVEPKEFLKSLKSIEKMSIAAKTDLISRSGDLFKPVQDIFGFGAPEQFFISADFKRPLTDVLRSKFLSLSSDAKNGILNRFVCVGKDDNGIETIFNTDNFTQKIIANVNKLENGLYLPSDVRFEIIHELDKGHTNVQEA